MRKTSFVEGPDSARLLNEFLAYLEQDGIVQEEERWELLSQKTYSRTERMTVGYVLNVASVLLVALWVGLISSEVYCCCRRRRGHCGRCSYDLRGGPNGCPECGWGRKDTGPAT